ncbi:MAG: hemolysin III family protein, partial [Mesorhizobium sp.]
MSDARPDTQLDIPFVGRWHYSRAEMIADGI